MSIFYKNYKIKKVTVFVDRVTKELFIIKTMIFLKLDALYLNRTQWNLTGYINLS